MTRPGLTAALGELERATGELCGSDPADLEQAAGLLARRGAALTAAMAELAGAGEAEQARLQAVLEAGWEFSERLKLVQAATRLQLREMHRLQFVARASGAGAATPWEPSLNTGGLAVDA